MKKQKKQNLLNVVIVILVLALIMLVGSAVYEEIININKEKLKDTVASTEKDNEDKEQNEIEEKEEEVPEEPSNEDTETEVKAEDEEQPDEEYVGEEEQEVSKEEDTTKSKDERAIELAKNEWGEDATVTFSVEEKKGNIYYVAVKSDATVITWYEVNTENWEISEYY